MMASILPLVVLLLIYMHSFGHYFHICRGSFFFILQLGVGLTI